MNKNDDQQQLIRVCEKVSYILEHGTDAEISALDAAIQWVREHPQAGQHGLHMSGDELSRAVTPSA